MKHLVTLLFLSASISASFSFAQSAVERSTGVVQLMAGFSTEIGMNPDEVTLTLNGPADRWFAIGFGAQAMTSGTDVAFYANGSQGAQLYDGRLVGNAAPLEDAIQDWTVLSNEVSGNTRTLLATRPLFTGNPNDFEFNFDSPTFTVIYAQGATASLNLAYHGASNRGFAVLPVADVVSTIAENSLLEGVSLFPNPANTSVYLRWPNNVQVSAVLLYDTRGRVVKSATAFENQGMIELGVSDLPAGLYFAELTSPHDRVVVKCAVQH